jgi:hypothetical protein
MLEYDSVTTEKWLETKMVEQDLIGGGGLAKGHLQFSCTLYEL